MKREKFLMHFGLLISLFCAACSGGTEQPDNNKPFLPISDDGVVNVYGELIDVRSVEKDSVYPINDVYTYDESLPTEVSKLKCAVSVKELRGVEKIACSQVCGVYVGSTEPISGVGWTDLGKSFTVSGDGKSVEYALYRYKIDKPMEWLDLPKLENQQASLLLFARDFKVQGTETFGTIIAKVHELRTANVTNPSIIRLPNGDLLAACNGVLRDVTGKGAWVTVFASTDNGKTWSVRNKGQFTMSYESMFLHNGVLYIMGADAAAGNVVIHASYDNGYTWSDAKDANSGLLIEGAFHSAPVPVAIWNGRIWRGMETNETNKKVFVMSAPVDANLLSASSWTSSNMLIYDKTWSVNGSGLHGSQMIEGNVIVGPDGKLVNVLRVDEERYGRTIAMVNVESSKKISFNPTTGFYTLPGGGKKFTVRFDEQSGRYWTITTPVNQVDYNKSFEGRYANGIKCGNIRNNMVLFSSLDLKEWRQERVIFAHEDPFFHGFQYVDWIFDGNDLLAVIRLAAPEERGLPTRQHDANMLSFVRVENFRTQQ